MNLQSTNISRINASPDRKFVVVFDHCYEAGETVRSTCCTIYRNNKEQRLSFIVASLKTGRIGLIFDENEF